MIYIEGIDYLNVVECLLKRKKINKILFF